MNTKQRGLNLSREYRDRTSTDYKFGAVKGIADEIGGLVIAVFAWPNPINGVYPRVVYPFNHVVIFFQKKLKMFFPEGEVQKGRQDFMDCVTRGHNNEIEKQLNWLIKEKKISVETIEWLHNNKYLNGRGEVELSDRFPAMLSNTTRNGNSIKAPIEAIRKYGCIPKSVLPAKDDMTFNQYHNKKDITEQMMNLGQEFLKRFTINYTIVNKRYFSQYAGDIRWDIFDNYEESEGDFIKRLASNYNFYYYGYQIHLNLTGYKEPPKENDDMLTTIKFATDARIFIVSPNNPKNLYWIGGNSDGAWDDYKLMLDEGIIKPFKEENDALMASYDIKAGIVKVDYYDEDRGSMWQRLFNIFKK